VREFGFVKRRPMRKVGCCSGEGGQVVEGKEIFSQAARLLRGDEVRESNSVSLDRLSQDV
jgi:hypothetical protein